MTRTLSCAATQLLRALRDQSGLRSDELVVGRFQSVDWQSLTFTGERHELLLRLAGPDPGAALARLRQDLAVAEWALAGHIVADIVIVSEKKLGDGAIEVALEALTLTG